MSAPAETQRQPAVLTIDEWAMLPEDECGEFVDGRLEAEEMGDLIHEFVVAWFILELGTWLRAHGGFVLASEAKFRVSSSRGRRPDATAFLQLGTGPRGRRLIRKPPDIALEVVSPSPRDQKRDRIEKLAEYAAFGIRWYWIADPALRSFEVFELRENAYAHVLGVTEGPADSVPGCPELRLDLPALWATVDALEKEEAEDTEREP